VKPPKTNLEMSLLHCLLPAAITGIILCSANYALDILFDRFGLPTSKTVMNDLVIGILGALAVFYYLSASRENHNFAIAKARIALIGELNHRIRQSLMDVSSSLMVEDRDARLQGLDEAITGIDDILLDFQDQQRANSHGD
jgi:hypothetical protein